MAGAGCFYQDRHSQPPLPHIFYTWLTLLRDPEGLRPGARSLATLAPLWHNLNRFLNQNYEQQNDDWLAALMTNGFTYQLSPSLKYFHSIMLDDFNQRSNLHWFISPQNFAPNLCQAEYLPVIMATTVWIFQQYGDIKSQTITEFLLSASHYRYHYELYIVADCQLGLHESAGQQSRINKISLCFGESWCREEAGLEWSLSW